MTAPKADPDEFDWDAAESASFIWEFGDLNIPTGKEGEETT